MTLHFAHHNNSDVVMQCIVVSMPSQLFAIRIYPCNAIIYMPDRRPTDVMFLSLLHHLVLLNIEHSFFAAETADVTVSMTRRRRMPEIC